MVWVQNQQVVAGTTEVSREVFDGGAMHETGVFPEVESLVSLLGDVSLCDLIEEVILFKD